MRTLSLSIPISLFALATLAAGSPGCAAGTGSEGGESASRPSEPSVDTKVGGSGGAASSEPTGAAPSPRPTTPAAAWNGSAPKGSVPVTGGTLILAADGNTVIAADPDRDMVSIVNLSKQAVSAQISLPSGAEPGRIAEDSAGIVHVVLRRGGGIADIDPVKGTLLGLRQTCALPRGIASGPTSGTLLVSCMTGELLTMSADPTNRQPLSSVTVHTATQNIEDLRDVLVTTAGVFVTTFRSANVLQVAADGSVASPVVLTTRPDQSVALFQQYSFANMLPQNFRPAVAWRAVVGPAGDIVVVHQGGSDRPIDIAPADQGLPNPATASTPGATECSGSGAYGGETCQSSCAGVLCAPPILIDMVSSVATSGAISDGPVIPDGSLPVDIAPTHDGQWYWVALAGNPAGVTGSDGSLLLSLAKVPSITQGLAGTPATGLSTTSPFDTDLCGQAFAGSGFVATNPNPNGNTQVTAVAVDAMDNPIAQTREPATIQYFVGATPVVISLSGVSATSPDAETGFETFHANTGRGLSCAGCHAEGQDDGLTWNFSDGLDANGNPINTVKRRTQTFRVGYLETAPFHWSAQFPDMPALVSDVFVHRMAAATAPTAAQEAALQLWMNSIQPRMHDAPTGEEAVSIANGKALFEDSSTKCTSCHSGAQTTDNKSHDIGFADGSDLQTPTLTDVGFRAPYLHDGSVATLEARFSDPTALSGKHGTTSQLSAAQITDLVAYLRSL